MAKKRSASSLISELKHKTRRKYSSDKYLDYSKNLETEFTSSGLRGYIETGPNQMERKSGIRS